VIREGRSRNWRWVSGGSGGTAGSALAQCIPEAPTKTPPPTAICGDRFLAPTDPCDDGNTLPDDGSSPSCQITPQLVRPRVQAVRETTRINAAADGVGSWGADLFYSGGGSYVSGNVVSTSGVENAAPAEVYQSEHVGDFSCTFSGLRHGSASSRGGRKKLQHGVSACNSLPSAGRIPRKGAA